MSFDKYPKIMDDLVQFLKLKGHSCPVICGTENHRFEWCEKDECPETVQLLNMKQRQEEQDKEVRELREQGHKCIRILHTYPSRMMWCGKSECSYNSQRMEDSQDDEEQSSDDLYRSFQSPDNIQHMKEEQEEQDKEEQKLREQGHKCIRIRQTYPSQMFWCEQEQCSYGK